MMELFEYMVSGMYVNSNEVVQDKFKAANEDEAEMMFELVYGPWPYPYNKIQGDYAVVFAVDMVQ